MVSASDDNLYELRLGIRVNLVLFGIGPEKT